MKTEFRRGVDFDTWQRLWHYNDECDKFPTRNFAVRLDRPSDDELCARCCSRKAYSSSKAEFSNIGSGQP